MYLPTDPPSSYFPGSDPDSFRFAFDDSPATDAVNMYTNPKLSPLAGFAISTAADIGKLLINQLLQDRATKKSQAYNDPAAQALRLKHAGINPAAVMGAISAHNTSQYNAAQDNSRVSPMELLQLQNVYEQNRMLKAQRRSVELDNDYKLRTFNDRVERVAKNLLATDLSNQLSTGKITYQQYANSMKHLEDDWLKWLSTPNASNYNGLSPREFSYFNQAYKSQYDKDTSFYHSNIEQYESDMKKIQRDWMDATGIDPSAPNSPFGFFFKTIQMIFHYLNRTHPGGGY